MNYDFFAILDQDVPRCRSWVRFMGPKCFTRSWGLGWGSHRRTYLSLTGVGSACYRPDRLERWLAKIKDLKGASIHMEKIRRVSDQDAPRRTVITDAGLIRLRGMT